MGNSRRPVAVVIVTALILGLCLTLLSAENRKAEPINSERPVYVEPMDPNAGPQAMYSDNPEFGGGPNYNSDTRLTPDPSLGNHKPIVVMVLTAIDIALVVSAIATALLAFFLALKDRKTTYTPEESDGADENVDADKNVDADENVNAEENVDAEENVNAGENVDAEEANVSR